MKRPEEMTENKAALEKAVKAWIDDSDPVEAKGITTIAHGEHGKAFKGFLLPDVHDEMEKQLKPFGWRVASFEWDKVVVKPA